MSQSGISIGEIHLRAWMINTDPELKQLRADKQAAEVELLMAERKIPEHVRDIETLELHLEGHTTGTLHDVMEQFISNYRQMSDFVEIYRRIGELERAITARLEQLGVPNTAN